MARRSSKASRRNEPFWKRHALSLTAAGVLALWLVLYVHWDPKSHAGSFFGNAAADWIGVVVTILATKWFFEKGIAREPPTAPSVP